MDAELARKVLTSLPHVMEVEQWGGLLSWLGDKASEGKIFALLHLDGKRHLISFAAGPERFAELCKLDWVRPAPYFAKAHRVAVERWDALRNAEWDDELRASHGLVLAKLPAKTRAMLALPARELKKAVAEGRKVLAEKSSAAGKIAN